MRLRCDRPIVACARDAGGAGAVGPVVAALSHRGHRLEVWAKDYAAAVFRTRGIVHRVLTAPTVARMRQMVGAAGVVLTGTSVGDHTEQILWQVCREHAVPSLAILDAWCNYRPRFTSPAGRWRLPDTVAVMDAGAADDLVAQGLPPERIRVTGNPYLDDIRRPQRCDGHRHTRMIRRQCGVASGDTLVVFATQAFALNGQRDRLGYDESVVVSLLQKALSSTPAPGNRKIICRVHPRDSQAFLIRRLPAGPIELSYDTDTLPRDLIEAADLVVGMTSMFLIEAVLMGVPAISIQPGDASADDLVLTRRGILPRCRTVADVVTQVRRIEHGWCPQWTVPADATARVCRLVEEVLNCTVAEGTDEHRYSSGC